MKLDTLSWGILFLVVIGVLVLVRSPQWEKWKGLLW